MFADNKSSKTSAFRLTPLAIHLRSIGDVGNPTDMPAISMPYVYELIAGSVKKLNKFADNYRLRNDKYLIPVDAFMRKNLENFKLEMHQIHLFKQIMPFYKYRGIYPSTRVVKGDEMLVERLQYLEERIDNDEHIEVHIYLLDSLIELLLGRAMLKKAQLFGVMQHVLDIPLITVTDPFVFSPITPMTKKIEHTSDNTGIPTEDRFIERIEGQDQLRTFPIGKSIISCSVFEFQVDIQGILSRVFHPMAIVAHLIGVIDRNGRVVYDAYGYFTHRETNTTGDTHASVDIGNGYSLWYTLEIICDSYEYVDLLTFHGPSAISDSSVDLPPSYQRLRANPDVYGKRLHKHYVETVVDKLASTDRSLPPFMRQPLSINGIYAERLEHNIREVFNARFASVMDLDDPQKAIFAHVLRGYIHLVPSHRTQLLNKQLCDFSLPANGHTKTFDEIQAYTRNVDSTFISERLAPFKDISKRILALEDSVFVAASERLRAYMNQYKNEGVIYIRKNDSNASIESIAEESTLLLTCFELLKEIFILITMNGVSIDSFDLFNEIINYDDPAEKELFDTGSFITYIYLYDQVIVPRMLDVLNVRNFYGELTNDIHEHYSESTSPETRRILFDRWLTVATLRDFCFASLEHQETLKARYQKDFNTLDTIFLAEFARKKIPRKEQHAPDHISAIATIRILNNQFTDATMANFFHIKNVKRALESNITYKDLMVLFEMAKSGEIPFDRKSDYTPFMNGDVLIKHSDRSDLLDTTLGKTLTAFTIMNAATDACLHFPSYMKSDQTQPLVSAYSEILEYTNPVNMNFMLKECANMRRSWFNSASYVPESRLPLTIMNAHNEEMLSKVENIREESTLEYDPLEEARYDIRKTYENPVTYAYMILDPVRRVVQKKQRAQYMKEFQPREIEVGARGERQQALEVKRLERKLTENDDMTDEESDVELPLSTEVNIVRQRSLHIDPYENMVDYNSLVTTKRQVNLTPVINADFESQFNARSIRRYYNGATRVLTPLWGRIYSKEYAPLRQLFVGSDTLIVHQDLYRWNYFNFLMQYHFDLTPMQIQSIVMRSRKTRQEQIGIDLMVRNLGLHFPEVVSGKLNAMEFLNFSEETRDLGLLQTGTIRYYDLASLAIYNPTSVGESYSRCMTLLTILLVVCMTLDFNILKAIDPIQVLPICVGPYGSTKKVDAPSIQEHIKRLFEPYNDTSQQHLYMLNRFYKLHQRFASIYCNGQSNAISRYLFSLLFNVSTVEGIVFTSEKIGKIDTRHVDFSSVLQATTLEQLDPPNVLTETLMPSQKKNFEVIKIQVSEPRSGVYFVRNPIVINILHTLFARLRKPIVVVPSITADGTNA